MDRRPPPRAPDSGHHEVASDSGGDRAAAIYTLIETCKLNDVDPFAYLRDVLAAHRRSQINRIDDLLPWNWASTPDVAAAA